MARIVFAAVLLAACRNVAFSFLVTPVEKVTKMLTELAEKVNEEGVEEAKTYDKFACFCKTNIGAKTKAISEGKTEKDSLQSKINKDSGVRVEEDTKIADKIKEIKAAEEEIAKAKADRKKERITYTKNEVELTSGLQALDSAIMAMKAAKKGVGFAQLPDMAKNGLVMAQSLMPEVAAKTLTAFISDDKPNEAYSFQGSEIIETLEGLKTDFRKKKDELGKTETEAKAAFDKLVQNKEQAVKDATEALETSKKDKAKASQRIATASKDLTTIASTLLDDQDFLSKLAKKCGEKAVLWDKRIKTRAAELQALTTAITLLKSLPPPDADKKKKALIDTGVSVPSPALAFVQVAEHIHRAKPAANASDTSPLGVPQPKQQKPVQSLAATAVATQLRSSTRARAVAVLKAQAQVLKSKVLADLVEHVAADPFVKVKQLIQALIERLLKQAAEEASHKGWCDKEYALATQKRDNSANDIKEANGLLEVSEARREKLGEEIEVLKEEIKDLGDTLKKSSEIRDKEKKDNEAAIKDAKEGKKVVEQAMDTLEKFYKTAANEAKSFLQVSTEEEPAEPDAGFDDEYAGAQDGSVGVLGMLEVVKSDFERVIKDTEAAEEKAKQSFQEQETDIGASKAAKGEALKASKSAKSDADADDSSTRDKLKGSQTILDKTLKEIDSLDKACQQGGMTAEERKQNREEEMEALKKALCILDSHGIGGAESC